MAAFQAVFEHAPIGMSVADLDYRLLRVNRAFAGLLGYQPGELVGRTSASITHPDDVAQTVRAPRELLAAGEAAPPSFRLEKRYLHRDGRAIWAQVTGFLIRDEQQRPRHWVSLALDVTAQRRAAEALRESEQRLRLAVTRAPSPIIIHAEDGEILYLSEGFTRFSGYGPDRLRTVADWARVAYGEGSAAKLELIRSLFDREPGRAEQVVTVEHPIRAADGSTRIWAFTSGPIGRGADGRRLAISMARDVTDERAAQARAGQALSILRGVIEASPSAVFAVDRAYRYTAFNATHAAIMLAIYRSEIAVGGSLLEAMAVPEDRTKAKANLDRALAGEVVVEEADSGAHGPGRRWFEVTHQPIRDADGRVDGVAVYARDLSARRQAELAREAALEELRRSNADLERFAYAASHDLQEPLRMVVSFLQLLERRAGGCLDAEAREFLDFALQGASRMQVLVADLLTFSRAGRGDLQAEPVDAGEALDLALGDLSVALREAGGTVRRGPLPRVQAIRSQLAQVFQNLVSNALKFAGDRPPLVEIDAAREAGAWHFRVRDHGIGVAPEHHERIFQLFQRLHGQDRFQGSGIGLAIAKRVVERLGGRIWVESTPGEGATFHFTLPAAGDEARP